MKVDPEWWKALFDETYLLTDARTVCDEKVTCREVDFLVEALSLKKSWPLLDLCGGQGRHALEFSRRGFQDITVLDYSPILIDLGRKRARKEGLNTLFLRDDARDTGLSSERFRVIIVMASSLGYFIEEDQNERILREAFRLLTPKGALLLDLPNREYVLNNFTPRTWHEAERDVVVCRHRRLDNDVIYSREMVISKKKGLIRDATYCTRLYSPEKIKKILTSSGFDSVTIRKDFVGNEREGDRGLVTNRMVVIAHKE
jgi:D-alanine-D-alanine ligase